MKDIIVFYAGQVLEELEDYNALKYYRVRSGQEIYNGAYIYAKKMAQGRHWWRMDGTPVLDRDVPAELKTWVLILS